MANENAKDGAALEGNPTMLIVDDEELMREVIAMMVEDNGGVAYTAVDGQDAVEIFTEKADEIDYVLMDFSMPRLNGYEAYIEIKKVKPSVGVVMFSGLSVTPEVEKLDRSGEIQFLRKPFHEADLVRAICKIRETQNN